MKDTITVEEIITLLEGCKPDTKMTDALMKLDPSLTMEQTHYLQARMKFKLKEDDMSPYTAAAAVLREERASAACAVFMYSYASFFYGQYTKEKNDMTSLLNSLTKLSILRKSMKENLDGKVQEG